MKINSRVMTWMVAVLLASSNASADTVLYLSPSPEPNNCSGVDVTACRALDAVEASGYAMARSGNMSWVKMVERFYQERSRYFPQMRDDHVTAEIRAYQRVLAERKDAGKITEAEWTFLLRKQFSAIVARENQVQGGRNSENAIQQLTQQQQYQQQQIQRQQMQQADIEQQQMLQNQALQQQQMQQRQMEQQQNWQRMQQR